MTQSLRQSSCSRRSWQGSSSSSNRVHWPYWPASHGAPSCPPPLSALALSFTRDRRLRQTVPLLSLDLAALQGAAQHLASLRLQGKLVLANVQALAQLSSLRSLCLLQQDQWGNRAYTPPDMWQAVAQLPQLQALEVPLVRVDLVQQLGLVLHHLTSLTAEAVSFSPAAGQAEEGCLVAAPPAL